jgi:hypothetical protein
VSESLGWSAKCPACDEWVEFDPFLTTTDSASDQPTDAPTWVRTGGTAPEGVTISADGWLNVPKGLPPGEYTVEYVEPPRAADQQSDA